jgi:hypothetical protein
MIFFSNVQEIRLMHGLWMVVNRQGVNILDRYESWVRSGLMMEGTMQTVDLRSGEKLILEFGDDFCFPGLARLPQSCQV